MIGWDATNQRSVQEILSGERPFFFQYYDQDWQRYNALLVSTYRREPFEGLLEDVQASYAQLQAFLHALPADQVLNGKVKGTTGRTITIRNLLRAQTTDELEHARQLKDFLAQTRQKTMQNPPV